MRRLVTVLAVPLALAVACTQDPAGRCDVDLARIERARRRCGAPVWPSLAERGLQRDPVGEVEQATELCERNRGAREALRGQRVTRDVRVRAGVERRRGVAG